MDTAHEELFYESGQRLAELAANVKDESTSVRQVISEALEIQARLASHAVRSRSVVEEPKDWEMHGVE